MLARHLALVNCTDSLAECGAWITIGNADERVGTDRAIAFAQALVYAALQHEASPQVTLQVLPTPGHASFAAWHEQAANMLAEMFANIQTTSTR